MTWCLETIYGKNLDITINKVTDQSLDLET